MRSSRAIWEVLIWVAVPSRRTVGLASPITASEWIGIACEHGRLAADADRGRGPPLVPLLPAMVATVGHRSVSGAVRLVRDRWNPVPPEAMAWAAKSVRQVGGGPAPLSPRPTPKPHGPSRQVVRQVRRVEARLVEAGWTCGCAATRPTPFRGWLVEAPWQDPVVQDHPLS
jgi:hypothetical protein